jgi:HTH-type transcriptional regulator / antitoxin MqsA
VKGLSGWRDADGEIVFDAESVRRYAAAGDELVLRDRQRQMLEIRRIRRKLRLTQVEASRLTGGGHKHPDLLKELQTEERCTAT